jgi:hypothetical protein
MGIQRMQLLIVTLVAVMLQFGTALAADQAEIKGIDKILAKPEENKDQTPPKAESGAPKECKEPEKTIVTGTRKPKSRKSAKTKQPSEPLPDQQMTIRQVMEILKKSRNLAGRNLSGLFLVGLDLSNCDLRGANLKGVNLERANLSESVLERADLTGSNLRMTDLRNTGLRGARLDGARLDGAIWPDGIICGRGSTGTCLE